MSSCIGGNPLVSLYLFTSFVMLFVSFAIALLAAYMLGVFFTQLGRRLEIVAPCFTKLMLSVSCWMSSNVAALVCILYSCSFSMGVANSLWSPLGAIVLNAKLDADCTNIFHIVGIPALLHRYSVPQRSFAEILIAARSTAFCLTCSLCEIPP
jgi:hypothetical protein